MSQPALAVIEVGRSGVEPATSDVKDVVPGAVPLDPSTDILLQLEAETNVNSLQIVLVDGLLDVALLRRAARDVAPRFPLLLSRPDPDSRQIVLNARTPDEILCEEVPCDRPFTFEDCLFRQAVVGPSLRHPIRWRDGVPVRLWVFRDASSGRSCLLVNTSHVTADAKADSLLLEALMARYGALLSGGNASKPEDGETFGFGSLERLFSGMLRRPALAGAGAVDAVREMIGRDAGFPVSRGAGRILDFHHEILTAELDDRIRRLSKASGHSVSTIFSALLARVVCERTERAGVSRSAHVRLVSAVSARSHAGPSAARHYRNFMLPCRIRVRSDQDSPAMLSAIGRQYQALKSGRVALELAKIAAVAGLLRRKGSRRLARWCIHRIQGTTACYSNPGIIEEDFRYFGHPSLAIAGYLGVGCVVAPLEFILYTPQINGRIHLNGIYWRDLLGDFKREIVIPVKRLLADLCRELGIG